VSNVLGQKRSTFSGVILGALFAFDTSLGEILVVSSIGSTSQKTMLWQIFIDLREPICPAVPAVATILVFVSVQLLATLEILHRRAERLPGISAN
jgi:putative spermidine/putrescine transport system permease protein